MLTLLLYMALSVFWCYSLTVLGLWSVIVKFAGHTHSTFRILLIRKFRYLTNKAIVKKTILRRCQWWETKRNTMCVALAFKISQQLFYYIEYISCDFGPLKPLTLRMNQAKLLNVLSSLPVSHAILYNYWLMRHWIWCDIDQIIPILTEAKPRSILVFSGRYHIISIASLVNNCFII